MAMTPQIPAIDPVDEATRWFKRLQIPELKEFLRRCGLPVGGNRVNLVDRIEVNLRSSKVDIETAFDYIDEVKEHGEQHLFLFRLKKGQHAHLNRLEDVGFVKTRVAAVRSLPTALGDRKAVHEQLYEPKPRDTVFFETKVDSSEPALVAAYWRGDQRQELFFKWVETRAWQQLVQSPPELKTYRERSVNFLRVDLQTGAAEIRIQKLNPNPEKSLQEEFALFRAEADKLVDFTHFSPVLIEPVIHRLLTSSTASVVNWKVNWIDSGNLGGGIDPARVRSLFRRFRNFSALSLTANWLFELRKVPVQLDGRTNEVLLRKRCSDYHLQVVLSDIHTVKAAALQIPELNKMAEKTEEWRPILLQIERELGSQKGQQRTDLRRIARESWFEEDQVFDVAERLATEHPHAFEVQYNLRCPETGQVAEDKNGRLQVLKRDEIPETFECRHTNPNRWEAHESAGNIDAILIFKPLEKTRPPLLPMIRPTIEHWVGKSNAAKYLNGLALLLFAVLYVPLVWGTAWMFLKLTTLFAGGIPVVMLSVPMGLALLFEAGIVVAVLGDPLTEQAKRVLEWLTALLDRRAARGEAAWPATVHAEPKQVSPEESQHNDGNS